jgi:alpha-beta hydrolase superfamily lysophospholipase
LTKLIGPDPIGAIEPHYWTNILICVSVHFMASGMLSSKEFHFSSSDGLPIACSRWDARGPSRGVLQIAHGLGEHIGRYAELIAALQEARVVVYGHDHRGHGRSARSPEEFGDYGNGGFDLLVEDMAELTRIAKEENPEQPFLLLGHSMGSFAAQQYLLEHSYSVDGVILSGSGVLDGMVRLSRSAAQKYNFLNAAFEPARTPFDWLSRDTAIVDAFLKDPLCFPMLKPASTASFLGAAACLADPARLSGIRQDLPVYLISGSEDPVGERLAGVRALMDRYHRAGVCDTSFDFYEGGRHEMLNETNRGEVRTNLLVWIAGVLRW